MKRIAVILGVLLIVGVLAACGESTVQQVNKEDAKAAEKASTKEKPKTKVYNIGDTVKFDDLEITLNKVRETKDQFMKPKNEKFVAIELDLKNTADKSANISTLMQMKLMTDEGVSMDQAIVDTRGQLDGELSAGRSMKGEVAYDVEKADFYEFIFENPFTNGQAIWKIPADKIK